MTRRRRFSLRTSQMIARSSLFILLLNSGGSCCNALSETTTTTTTTAAYNNNHKNGPNKVLSLPLIPHHVEKRRRRLERRRQDGVDATNDEEASSLEDLIDRSHYPRRHLLDEDNDDNDENNDEQQHDELQVASVFQGYGTHYVDLWCGSPTPQRQTVIVDTGSAVTAFPCSECDDCGAGQYHADSTYDETASDTFYKLQCNECVRGYCSNWNDKAAAGDCTIGMKYQEGSSWSAYESQDLCYVGGLHRRPLHGEEEENQQDSAADDDDLDPFRAPSYTFDLSFGCQTSVTGLFKTQLADGIMGMDIADTSFWKQMYLAGKIDSKAFALCYSRQDVVNRKGTVAGAMTLGGVDRRLHDGTMVYTPISKTSGFYNVQLRKVHMRQADAKAGNDVVTLDISERDLNAGRVIVDSGTTDTYFTKKIASAFQSAWKQMTGMDYSHTGMTLSKEEMNSFPTIIFQFAGDQDKNQEIVDANSDGSSNPILNLAGDTDPDHPLDVLVHMPPEHYFEYSTSTGKYVARFYTDEGSGTVFGANTMMGHDVLFDVDNYRIGWAKSDCDYEELVQPYLESHLGKDDNDNEEEEERDVY